MGVSSAGTRAPLSSVPSRASGVLSEGEAWWTDVPLRSLSSSGWFLPVWLRDTITSRLQADCVLYALRRRLLVCQVPDSPSGVRARGCPLLQKKKLRPREAP